MTVVSKAFLAVDQLRGWSLLPRCHDISPSLPLFSPCRASCSESATSCTSTTKSFGASILVSDGLNGGRVGGKLDVDQKRSLRWRAGVVQTGGARKPASESVFEQMRNRQRLRKFTRS
jgi:mRNA-degrading endonuclease toxin of MazEF toxin-antitoxin module